MRLRMRHTLACLLFAAVCCTPAGGPPRQRPAVPPPQRVRMLFGGDVMQHLPQVEAARSGEGFDYTPVFAALAPRMHAADLAVVNLETTLTRSGRYTGYPLFRSPAELADALRGAGVDVALLANNHCCDGGAEGIRTTIRELDRCGIRHTGVFADSADYRRNHPLRIEHCGLRIALVNYTYGTNGMPVPAGSVVNRIDTVRMAADLAAVRREGADFIVACMHWGNEYERRENASQRTLAAFLRRHGADVVVGGHPHVVQPWQADWCSIRSETSSRTSAAATPMAGWSPGSKPCVIRTVVGATASNRFPYGSLCPAIASCRPRRPTPQPCPMPTPSSVATCAN